MLLTFSGVFIRLTNLCAYSQSWPKLASQNASMHLNCIRYEFISAMYYLGKVPFLLEITLLNFENQACEKRIETAKEGDCEPWYFDYYKCLDKCVSISFLFNYVAHFFLLFESFPFSESHLLILIALSVSHKSWNIWNSLQNNHKNSNAHSSFCVDIVVVLTLVSW